MYHHRPTRATILAIDSSFAAEGEGSESKSPKETLASSDVRDFEGVWVQCIPAAVVTEIAGRDTAVDEEVPVAERDLFDEEVVELEDLTTMPATGMRTMQRRRLSNP